MADSGDVSRETSDTYRELRFGAIEDALSLRLSDHQRSQLIRYERWLSDEALRAGGIGPGESERLFDRHIADSLAFLSGIDATCDRLVDVGSGVGLPGIPLAIAMPDCRVTLVDRAERRSRLARRAARILDLGNVEVLNADARHAGSGFDVAVFRASLTVSAAAEMLGGLVHAGGIGLVAVSRLPATPELPDPPPGVAFELSSWGSGVLDSPYWLLRMRLIHID